jgi:phage terminase large subunit
MTELNLNLHVRPLLRPLVRPTTRFSIAVCHRRAGKTVASAQRLLFSALTCERPNPRVAYISPTFGQAKRAAWDYLKEMAAPVLKASPHESELRLDLVNNARINCFGAENGEALRGVYLDDVVLDEAADMAPSFWPTVVRPTLSDRGGKALFIGTPKGRNEFHRIYEAARTDPTWTALLLPAQATGFISEAELAAARRDLTPEQWEQEYGCSFDAAILGAYFGRELAEAEAAGRITSVPYDPALEVHTSWDLGVGDSTSIWFFQVSRDGLRVIDYYEASGYGLPHYASVLSALGYNYGTEYLPHDARARQLGTGRSLWETLYSLTNRIPRILPAQNVMDGINAARVTIGSAWFDSEKCHDGLEMLRAYRADYDEKAKVFHNRPRHDFSSHCADSWRYLSMAWRETQPERPPEKKQDSWDLVFERALSRDAYADHSWRTA